MKSQICKNCGAFFSVKTLNTTLCSDTCREIVMKQRVKTRKANPECRANDLKRRKEWEAAAKAVDPGWQQRANNRSREWRKKNPSARAREIERERKRMTEPAYRARKNKRASEYAKIKRTTDPAWLERRRESQRKRYDVKKNTIEYQGKVKEWSNRRNRKIAAILAAVKELGLINMGDIKC